jgi:hypothetical protein
MPTKLHLDYAEFYITNSCNFNCVGCNRFNNYSFNGIQKWTDYADDYKKWAQILDIDRWTILGGEPMMNPSYLDWLKNIIDFWPTAHGSFLSNGHFLHENNRELYNILQATSGRVKFNIGLHNINRSQAVLNTVKLWLRGSISVERVPNDIKKLPNFEENWRSSYKNIRDPSWPNCDSIDDWTSLPEHIKKECREIFEFSPEQIAEKRKGWNLIDSNGVEVNIEMENYFHQGALKKSNSQNFTLHNSNPDQAHSICHSKTCHHFDKGKLYKCGQVSIFKEFDQQFYLDLSDYDRKLIHSYTPADPDQEWTSLQTFIGNLDRPISACKFCPDHYETKQIFAEHGNKVKLMRKK